MKPIGGYLHHLHVGAAPRKTSNEPGPTPDRRARRALKRGKLPRRTVIGDLHVGAIERAHETEHGSRCDCDLAVESEESDRWMFPDDFVGLGDDEHPQPFGAAMWLAFLGLPR